MADLSKSGRIRDPVHGYVFFTGVERVIIDHPIAQRLRHIAQSGMAQMVFPEVRSSRFSHSLGAMHLASQFLSSSLLNAEDGVRARIQETMKDALDEIAEFGVGATEEEVRSFYKGQGLRVDSCVDDDFRLAAILFEQGLRLAALFHDLGHLPFSHDFETALEEVLRLEQSDEFSALAQQTELAIHEQIGYRLAHHVQRMLFAEVRDEHLGRAVEVAFSIAKKVLHAPSPTAAGAVPSSAIDGLYRWLHSLIAGELDVDRCDYILRDTRHYGFEFASYDLKRIVDNLIVVQEGGEHGLVLAILPQGQSAAESFLIARFRMYQWGVRHHKVVQIAAALRKVIRDLLKPAIGGAGDPELHQFLLDIRDIIGSDGQPAFADDRRDVLGRFVGYDDVWWTRKMREAEVKSDGDAWLELARYRRPGPISLWKRPTEFPGNLSDWNAKLPPKDDLEGSREWEQARSQLEQEGVLVVRHSFQPWERLDQTDPDSESALCIWDRRSGRLISLTKLSPLVKEMRSAWQADIQVHAFVDRDGSFDAIEVIGRLPVIPAEVGGYV